MSHVVNSYYPGQHRSTVSITCYVQSLIYSKKTNRHMDKQENGIHSQEEKISIETDSAITQILNLADKDFKIIMINMLKI